MVVENWIKGIFRKYWRFFFFLYFSIGFTDIVENFIDYLMEVYLIFGEKYIWNELLYIWDHGLIPETVNERFPAISKALKTFPSIDFYSDVFF